MDKLKDAQQMEDICSIVDLFASEYGWSIETIQNLTIPEASCLVKCILRRRGVKEDDMPGKLPAAKEAENLVKLAKQLGASSEQIKELKTGKQVKI